ncbi:MAG TPA: lactate utilization protein [Coxiellaceae bacterium]|nr:lactate utilization protein [Coxiellaceae bacterium]
MMGKLIMNHCNVEILAKNLSHHNIGFLRFNTKEEVLAYFKNTLSQAMQIAWGGSMTLNECGILNYLRTEKFPHLLDRDNPALEDEARVEIERKTFFCDVYLTSANALTEDGLIVNIDGGGNRVAATIFGPKQVYFVVGINKLVKDYDAAIHRIQNFVAQKNAERLGLSPPCVKTMACQNCASPHRICNYFTAIKRDYRPNRTHVLLVNEKLGL